MLKTSVERHGKEDTIGWKNRVFGCIQLSKGSVCTFFAFPVVVRVEEGMSLSVSEFPER